MKKLIIACVFGVFSLCLYSQEKGELKIDSVIVVHMETGEMLQILHPPYDNTEEVLDSLSVKHKSFMFYLVHYLNDGQVVQCRIRKRKEKLKKI